MTLKPIAIALAIGALAAPLALSASPALLLAQSATTAAPATAGASRAGMPASGMRGVSSADRTFVQKAAEGGEKEIALSRMALEKSTNDDVKRYAQMLVGDHTKAGDELKQIAAAQNVEMRGDPKAKAEAEAAKMRKLSGAAFDRRYVQTMTSAHVADVKLFQNEAKNGSNADLKAFAAKTLPTLQAHLEQVRAMKMR